MHIGSKLYSLNLLKSKSDSIVFLENIYFDNKLFREENLYETLGVAVKKKSLLFFLGGRLKTDKENTKALLVFKPFKNRIIGAIKGDQGEYICRDMNLPIFENLSLFEINETYSGIIGREKKIETYEEESTKIADILTSFPALDFLILGGCHRPSKYLHPDTYVDRKDNQVKERSIATVASSGFLVESSMGNIVKRHAPAIGVPIVYFRKGGIDADIDTLCWN